MEGVVRRMYISNIQIKNYKNFRSNIIEFNEGINVIIGHNNAGKSNLLRAMALIFNPSVKKHLTVDDFNKTIPLEELKSQPPRVNVSITLSQEDEENIMGDDLVVVSQWLTKLEEPYEAKLHYEFCLPLKHHEDYERMLSTSTSIIEAWEIIDKNFLRLYTYKIYGGNLENQIAVDSEYLKKFDFQFLDAIRDVERDMFSGKNTLLKNVLDFFMDFDIKSNKDLDDHNKEQQIKAKKMEFEEQARDLMDSLNKRMSEGKKQILSYSKDIGASFDNVEPNFAGSITDIELYSALKLIVEYQTGIQLPITHNGLGYNNLIFMSLLLAKMQVNASETYLGSNAKVFPMLVIEEPEAHLHPSMQRQLLKFLKQNLKDKKVRQIFVTTHSTHITGALSLDELICLYKADNVTNVSYPGKVFGTNEESKKYVQRFLDATKSNMLFAEKLILVEGLAEQLLMSIFAEYIGKSLDDNHIAVINVGGKYFDHFLNLFNINNSAINRKVVCITDRDPERKIISTDKQSFKKCYPFEMQIDTTTYEYRFNKRDEDYSSNIEFFLQDDVFGKTLEYDLIRYNPTFEGLITDSMSNKKEITDLMKLLGEGKGLEELCDRLSKSEENARIIEAIKQTNLTWREADKKIALIAARYLNSVGKGVNALELAYVLQENLAKHGKEGYVEFVVPKYIKEAIEWVCEN